MREQPEGSSGASRSHRLWQEKLHADMHRMNAPLQRSTAAAEEHEYPAPLMQHDADDELDGCGTGASCTVTLTFGISAPPIEMVVPGAVTVVD